MPILSDLRTRVRQDLRDTASPQEFTDAELDRWLDRAVGEVSVARPREMESVLDADGTTRNLSLSGLTLLLAVYSVEYPVGEWPPSYVRFDVYGTTLTMHIDGVPVAGEDVKVRWGKVHTLDASGTTLTEDLEDVVVLGAAAYALDAYAAAGASKLLTTGAGGQRSLSSEAGERLRAYGSALRGLRSRVRRRELYAPERASPSQDRDAGPP